MRRIALLVLLGVCVGSGAFAQQARVQVAPAPHYVGEPVRILVSVDGLEEEPTPEVQSASPGGGRLRLAGISPKVSQSISIVHGRVSRTREVTHVFEFHYEASEPGSVTVGPIQISQGGASLSIRPIRLEIGRPPTRDDIAIELILPDRPIYVGERAPVVLRMRLPRELQRNMEGYTLRVPLFDESADFRFLEVERPGQTQLVVTTDAGSLTLHGEATEVSKGRGRELVIRAERILVPLSEGRHEIDPPRLLVNEGVRFQRDLFGGRRATQVRKWQVSGPPASIEVKAIPEAGRPASFAGTVGRGFTLDVTADRTVVRVGDPITLTLQLRGEGLETAALPPLSAEGLLPPSGFRVPEGERTGEHRGDTKQFSAVVRVTNPSVDGIPALAFSWFNPTTERFETTQSRPIALSVGEGFVVGAADVERAQPPESALSLIEAPTDSARGAATAATAADLAIERAPEVLLRDARSGATRAVAVACYAGGVLLLVLASVDRRRRDEDPAVRARRVAFALQTRRLREAGSLPGDQGLDALADALRRIRAEAPECEAAAIEALVEECDARRFAPGAASLDPELQERAETAAREFAERPR